MSRRETLLVTGATGFLGSAIAAELLDQHRDIGLLFLVRAKDAADGLQRLRCSIAKMEPGASALSRLSTDSVICGELGDFSAQLGDSRVRSVTRIVNSAALASFAWKREIWSINVEHTAKFARAVTGLPLLRRFLHVSTAMISGNTAHRAIEEHEFPADVRQYVPYTRSKAEIERRLPEALGRVPLVIARPSVVVGHTRVGCRPSPSIFWMFRMIHAAGRITFPARQRIDIVPVDYCARALIQLALKPDLAHACYHVSSGPDRSCSFAEIDRSYSAAKNELRRELVEFRLAEVAALEPSFSDWFGPCDPRHIISAARIYHAFAGLDVTFDNRRLLAEGIEAPPRLTDYLEACVRTGEDQLIAEQMVYDFR